MASIEPSAFLKNASVRAFGERGVGGVVVLAARPGEGVVAARVGEELDLRVVLQRGDDQLLGLLRHELVLLGDVQHQRVGQLVGLAEVLLDADAVVADRWRRRRCGSAVRKASRPPRQKPTAPTLPLQPASSRTWAMVAAMSLTPSVDVEGVEELERPLPLGLGLVGDVDARLDAPEEVGADGEVALRGEVVGDAAHDRVDAEDLLDDDDGRGLGRGRARDVGARTSPSGVVIVTRLAHGAAPPSLRGRACAARLVRRRSRHSMRPHSDEARGG